MLSLVLGISGMIHTPQGRHPFATAFLADVMMFCRPFGGSFNEVAFLVGCTRRAMPHAFAAADDTPSEPAANIPELKVLNNWVGKWDDEMNVKPNAGLPNGMRAKGQVTAEWGAQWPLRPTEFEF